MRRGESGSPKNAQRCGGRHAPPYFDGLLLLMQGDAAMPRPRNGTENFVRPTIYGRSATRR